MGFARASSRRSVSRAAPRQQVVKIVVEHATASAISRPAQGLMNRLLATVKPATKKAKL